MDNEILVWQYDGKTSYVNSLSSEVCVVWFQLYWLIFWVFKETSPGWIPEDLVDGKSVLVEIMVLCRKPLPKPMLTKVSDTIWRH